MGKARIDIRGLRSEIAKKGFSIFKREAVPRIEKKLKQETLRLLAAFEDHEVTREIEAGPGARGSSGALGGYGNLFTFIGFGRGQDPISPLRSLLAQSIKVVGVRKQRKKLGLTLKFTVPTEEEIAAVTPLPWASASWVDAVERGMSGVGRYLYSEDTGKFQTSRSGQAIEATVEVRGSGSSQPMKYISQLLADMLINIERSLKSL